MPTGATTPDPDGLTGGEAGAIDIGGASLAWTLVGSSLFVSHVEGDASAFGALVAKANAIAVGRFAAVLVVRVREDDERASDLRKLGFYDDGEPVEGYVSLVRDVR